MFFTPDMTAVEAVSVYTISAMIFFILGGAFTLGYVTMNRNPVTEAEEKTLRTSMTVSLIITIVLGGVVLSSVVADREKVDAAKESNTVQVESFITELETRYDVELSDGVVDQWFPDPYDQDSFNDLPLNTPVEGFFTTRTGAYTASLILTQPEPDIWVLLVGNDGTSYIPMDEAVSWLR